MLEQVGLYEVRERMSNKLSGGMKRRLGIAQAIIGNPKILIVDEPTTGLDPEERIRFRNILTEMSEKDIIIVLSTHIVGDISSTCRNMALLNKGEVVFNGPPDELIDLAIEGGYLETPEAQSLFSSQTIDLGEQMGLTEELAPIRMLVMFLSKSFMSSFKISRLYISAESLLATTPDDFGACSMSIFAAPAAL